MKVLVCGDREWSDEDKMRKRLAQLPFDTIIIHGDCRGADRMSGDIAFKLGFGVIPFPAEWVHYGRAAGPIRNQQMLDEHPDLVLAFHSDIANSTGTADMIARARKKGTPAELTK